MHPIMMNWLVGVVVATLVLFFTHPQIGKQKTKLNNPSRSTWWNNAFNLAFFYWGGGTNLWVHLGGSGVHLGGTGLHDCIEAKVAKKPRGPHFDGVLWMGPKGAAKIVKQVMTPKDPELEGRALAVWMSRGPFDICMVPGMCRTKEKDRGSASLFLSNAT